MGLPEGSTLTHRDQVQDQAMQKYRQIMAPIWFSDDLVAQTEYINIPGNHRNITQNHCFTKGEEVKGTISVYSFKHPNSQKVMTLEGRDFDLTKLPNWLIESGYIGDNSITPDLEGQGLMTILVQEMIQRFPHAFIVGITGESNIGMQKVFEKTGATISNHFPYFVRPSNPRAISKEIGNSSFEHIPLFIDTKYPPVIHLFQNKDGLLICGAIGTTPNFPNRSTATHEGNSELFPNQIVGFINPEVELSPTELDSIYGKIVRFKYLSLFQLNNKAGENSKSLQSGYEQGWVTALYQR